MIRSLLAALVERKILSTNVALDIGPKPIGGKTEARFMVFKRKEIEIKSHKKTPVPFYTDTANFKVR